MRTRSLFVTLVFAACSHSAAPAPANTSTPTSAACPAAKQTTDICAAVVTYGKTSAGACCMYGSPCQVPFDGPQYSDAACTVAAGPASTPQ